MPSEQGYLRSTLITYLRLKQEEVKRRLQEQKSTLSSQEAKFLKEEITHIERLIKRMDKKGFCLGIATISAAMNVIGKGEWWDKVVERLSEFGDPLHELNAADLDNPLLLDPSDTHPSTLRAILERAVHYVLFTHARPERLPAGATLTDLSQENLLRPDKKLFEIVDAAGEIKQVQKLKSFYGFFPQAEKLSKILDEASIEGNICLILGKRHAISLVKNKNGWILYDPNHNPLRTKDTMKIAEAIIASLDTDFAIQIASLNKETELHLISYKDMAASDIAINFDPTHFWLAELIDFSPDELQYIIKKSSDDSDEAKSIRDVIELAFADKRHFEFEDIPLKAPSALPEFLELCRLHKFFSKYENKTIKALRTRNKEGLTNFESLAFSSKEKRVEMLKIAENNRTLMKLFIDSFSTKDGKNNTLSYYIAEDKEQLETVLKIYNHLKQDGFFDKRVAAELLNNFSRGLSDSQEKPSGMLYEQLITALPSSEKEQTTQEQKILSQAKHYSDTHPDIPSPETIIPLPTQPETTSKISSSLAYDEKEVYNLSTENNTNQKENKIEALFPGMLDDYINEDNEWRELSAKEFIELKHNLIDALYTSLITKNPQIDTLPEIERNHLFDEAFMNQKVIWKFTEQLKTIDQTLPGFYDAFKEHDVYRKNLSTKDKGQYTTRLVEKWHSIIKSRPNFDLLPENIQRGLLNKASIAFKKEWLEEHPEITSKQSTLDKTPKPFSKK